MSSPFKTVIAAVDFSESSLSALDKAVAVARDAGGTLHMLTVVPDPLFQSWGAEASGVDLGELRRVWVEDAERELAVLAAQRKLTPHDVRPTVLVGGAAEQIVRFAADCQADLLVLGRHGHGHLRRFLLGPVLGSVADRVLRQADCPVLLTPHPDAPRGDPLRESAVDVRW